MQDIRDYMALSQPKKFARRARVVLEHARAKGLKVEFIPRLKEGGLVKSVVATKLLVNNKEVLVQQNSTGMVGLNYQNLRHVYALVIHLVIPGTKDQVLVIPSTELLKVYFKKNKQPTIVSIVAKKLNLLQYKDAWKIF